MRAFSRRPRGSTTPATSTTPAVSPSSRRSPASPATTSWPRPIQALRNLDHRGAVGRRARLRRRRRHPHPGPRPLPARGRRLRAARAAHATPSAPPSCPATPTRSPRPRPRIEQIAAEEGLHVLGWRDVPTDARPARLPSRTARCRPSASCSSRARDGRARHGAGAARLLPAQAGRARDRGLLPLAVLAHARLQGHAHHRPARPLLPRPGRRAGRVGASALVHSRFSTNTFPSWPLAHPFRFIAHNGEINTVMGNRNWMRAREALLASDADPRRPRAALPDLHPGASDSASFDEVLELLHMGGRIAAARGADDDPRGVGEPRRDGRPAPRVLRVPLHADGAVGRPGLRDLHRRHPGRRGPRPQRAAPQPLLGHRRRAGRARLRGRRPRHRPRHRGPQGPAAAGPDVPRRHRRAPDHRGRGDQGRARRRAPVRRVAARRAHQARGPRRPRARRPHARLGDPPPAGLRLHRGGEARPARADGQDRRRADRLDGHRHPDRGAVGAAAAAVRLLQPAVRPGHQPAARRDPRGARHLAQRHASARRATCSTPSAALLPPGRAAVPGHRQRRAGQDPSHQP